MQQLAQRVAASVSQTDQRFPYPMLPVLPASKILITGPTRSGKSEWAEQLAQATQQPVIYIATAQVDPTDPEWSDRLEQHRQRRPPSWQTLEVPLALPEALCQHQDPNTCLLIDSLGTWVANSLTLASEPWQAQQTALLSQIHTTPATIILVAEETGWGVVPAYPLGRLFRDRLGTLIRQVAPFTTETYLVVAGHAINLKTLGVPVLTPPASLDEN